MPTYFLHPKKKIFCFQAREGPFPTEHQFYKKNIEIRLTQIRKSRYDRKMFNIERRKYVGFRHTEGFFRYSISFAKKNG